jgi:hypothetical protein
MTAPRIGAEIFFVGTGWRPGDPAHWPAAGLPLHGA